MSFPNSGAVADELNSLFTATPESIADLMDVITKSIYSKKMKIKYRHDGYDPITGEYSPKKKELCECAQKEWGSYGIDGLNVCEICNGAGVKGGWKEEYFRGFFWNTNPSGLKDFAEIFSITVPIERADGLVFISANEDRKKFKVGNFIEVNIADKNDIEEDWEEFQIMTSRPVLVGDKVVWRRLIITRQPVRQT